MKNALRAFLRQIINESNGDAPPGMTSQEFWSLYGQRNSVTLGSPGATGTVTVNAVTPPNPPLALFTAADFDAAKQWLTSNQSSIALASESMLNEDDDALAALSTLTLDAIKRDSEAGSNWPLCQIALALSITPPGAGTQLANIGFQIIEDVVKTYLLAGLAERAK